MITCPYCKTTIRCPRCEGYICPTCGVDLLGIEVDVHVKIPPRISQQIDVKVEKQDKFAS